MPILDATFLIDAKRHPEQTRPAMERAVNLAEPMVVPIQAAIEFSAGVKDPERGMMDLEASFQVVACTPAIAREAARLARAGFEQGVFLGWADVQVAATARYLGMFVVTRNIRHFEALDVPVWDYRAQPDPPDL